MKKNNILFTVLIILATALTTGCSAIGDKTTSMSVVYLTTTIFSLVMLTWYFLGIKKKDIWFIVLFVSVFIINFGYLSLSTSGTLNIALWSNRASYLGSVFLPPSMIMIILRTTGHHYKKYFPSVLLCISIIVFLIAASPGYLDIYYKTVSLEQIDGVSLLNKEYGSWHCIYLFYLTGCFALMSVIAIQAVIKKKIDSTIHAVILLSAVFVNMCVWLIEQLVKIDFEFLSVSYIITESFLIALYLMIQYQETQIASLQEKFDKLKKKSSVVPPESSAEFVEQSKFFAQQLPQLTATERAIYNCYLDGKSTKEVLAQMSITENTLKFHNKNIYSKLGVSSRKELLLYANAINNNQTT